MKDNDEERVSRIDALLTKLRLNNADLQELVRQAQQRAQASSGTAKRKAANSAPYPRQVSRKK